MKPAPFKYYAPETLSECLELLNKYGDGARVLAGGQSLVPIMNFRLASPEVIVDINNVRALSYISVLSDGSASIGAMTRQRSLEMDLEVLKSHPVIKEAMQYIGHFQTRNRGTIGGSIAHADPSAELPAVIMALDAEVTASSISSQKTLKARQFFLGPFTTALEHGEVITSVQLPPLRANTGYSVLETARQKGAFAMSGVVTLLTLDSSGVCADGRIAIFGVADAPVYCEKASEQLIGSRLDEGDLKNAAEAAVSGVDFIADIHASSEYRQYLTRNLVKRSLKAALSRGLAVKGARVDQ